MQHPEVEEAIASGIGYSEGFLKDVIPDDVTMDILSYKTIDLIMTTYTGVRKIIFAISELVIQ